MKSSKGHTSVNAFFICILFFVLMHQAEKKEREQMVDGQPGVTAEWLNIILRRLNKVQTHFLPHRPLKEVASLAGSFFFFFFSDTLKLPAASKLHLIFFSSLLAKITQHHLVKESGHFLRFFFFFNHLQIK